MQLDEDIVGSAYPVMREARPLAVALAGSVLLHAALLAAVQFQLAWTEAIGGGGTTLEAISVDVVTAAALEARENQPRADATAPPSGSVAEIDGQAGEPSETSAADATDRPKPDDVVPPLPEPTERVAEKDRSPLLAALPEPAETAALPTAAEAAIPTASEAAWTAERQPDPVNEDRPRDTVPEQPQPSLPSSAGPPSGGSASRGSEGPSATSARAAASPGALRHYALAVSKALETAKQKSKSNGRRGRTTVTFILTVDGVLEAVQVVKESGVSAIDTAALQLLQRASFPRPPPGATRAELTYTVPIDFR